MTEEMLKREAAKALLARVNEYLPKVLSLIRAWGRGATDAVLEVRLGHLVGKENGGVALNLFKAYRDIYFNQFKAARRASEMVAELVELKPASEVRLEDLFSPQQLKKLDAAAKKEKYDPIAAARRVRNVR